MCPSQNDSSTGPISLWRLVELLYHDHVYLPPLLEDWSCTPWFSPLKEAKSWLPEIVVSQYS